VLRRFRALKSVSWQVKHPACRSRTVATRSPANVLTGTLMTVGSSRGAPAIQAARRAASRQRWNAAPNVSGVRQIREFVVARGGLTRTVAVPPGLIDRLRQRH